MNKFLAILDIDVYQDNFLEKAYDVTKSHKPDIMLRAKHLKGKIFYEYAKTLKEFSREFDIRLLINERFDIAKIVKAHGVHMPSQGLRVDVVKSLFDGVVGYSAHSKEEALLAQSLGADYITLSPIFPTKSHENVTPLGLNYLKDVVASVNIPVYALGGITKENIDDVFSTGAYGIASIRMFL